MTTTISKAALRPWNHLVNYLPPLLIISSPLSLPGTVKKDSSKLWIIDNRRDPMHTSSQPPKLLIFVQHWLVIMPDVPLRNTEPWAAIVNLDKNFHSLDEGYNTPAGSITTHHSATRHQQTLKKLTQYLRDLPMLPIFIHVQQIVPPQKVWNWLPITFSELITVSPMQICNLFLLYSIMGLLVTNTYSSSQQ